MTSEILVVGSLKTGAADEQVFRKAKRKTFSDQTDSVGNEDENACAKRQKTEEDCLKRQEVVILNGNWDTGQTISSNLEDMDSIKIYVVDVNESCILLSESGVTEMTVEDINSTFEQVSVGATCMDLDTVVSEFIPLTEPSGTEYKDINDHKKNCDYDLSCFLKFKSGALVNGDEVEQIHNYKGQEVQETACPAVSTSPNGDISLSSSGFHVTENTAECGHSLLPSADGMTRPPFTYTQLIEKAIQEKGQLTLKEIYQWISEHFPFYKLNDGTWKNSVRHTLTVSPHFHKAGKATHRAGHLWSVAKGCESFQETLVRNQYLQHFISNPLTIEEVERALADIEDNKENQDPHTEILLSVNVENCAEAKST